MRGWTHYLSGLVMATFFPTLLADLARGVMLPVISGVYGYLPDFIDFKFRRFTWRRDIVIDPAPQDPRRKISPRRIRISELDSLEKWRFYYLEGVVESIVDRGDRSIVFTLRDETGLIKVKARDEDYEKLMSITRHIEPGIWVRLPGYLDIDEKGELYWNIADSFHPQYVAESVARAIDRAFETGEMITVKIYNVRLKGDLYRRFMIQYDSVDNTIRVFMGPVVSTGGLPVEKTSTPRYRYIGEAKTRYPFRKVYPRPTIIDAFSGPEIGFIRVRDGDRDVVEEVFIPWHRGFTHSFIAGFLLALPLLPILYLIGYVNYLELTAACILGYWMHVLEDQMGYMGSVLLPPLTKKRIPGFMLGPRIYGLMNFATAWLMIALAIWNINRYLPVISPGTPRVIDIPDIPLLLLITLPSIVIYIAGVVDRLLYTGVLKLKKREKEEEESLEEIEEVGSF